MVTDLVTVDGNRIAAKRLGFLALDKYFIDSNSRLH